MPRNLIINFNNEPCYEIIISNSIDKLDSEILDKTRKTYKRVCIVTDSNVAELYLASVTIILERTFDTVRSFTFPAGEASKNLDIVQKLYTYLIENNFDRKDLLVALGGGVTGDMTGFAAATYLRGIDFIQVPTSLLSCVDSSIGGKTGVDFLSYKNMVGSFYMPKLVYINTSFLDTLPDKQFSTGMAEIIKHGLIKNFFYYTWLHDNVNLIKGRDKDTLEYMIYESCKIKKKVVENDPLEKGERALLNFGHTLGHAIEKASDFSLTHGECVALGSVAASFISLNRGHITESEYMSIINTFDSFNLEMPISGYSKDMIVKETKHDKKMDGDKLRFILLQKMGNAYIDDTVSDEELKEALSNILME